jgi:hypothetical protein
MGDLHNPDEAGELVTVPEPGPPSARRETGPRGLEAVEEIGEPVAVPMGDGQRHHHGRSALGENRRGEGG